MLILFDKMFLQRHSNWFTFLSPKHIYKNIKSSNNKQIKTLHLFHKQLFREYFPENSGRGCWPHNVAKNQVVIANWAFQDSNRQGKQKNNSNKKNSNKQHTNKKTYNWKWQCEKCTKSILWHDYKHFTSILYSFYRHTIITFRTTLLN